MLSVVYTSLALLAVGQPAAPPEASVPVQIRPAPVVPPPRTVAPVPVKAPPPPARTRAARPRSNPGTWIVSNDYPILSMLMMEEGRVIVYLGVDKRGRVDSCEVIQSSGFVRLDDLTCRQLQRRARFDPPVDGNGQPYAGSYVQSVRWKIPSGSPIPASAMGWRRSKEAREQKARGVVRFSVTTDERGNVATCFATTSSGFDILRKETCNYIRSLGLQSPGRDKQGNSIPRQFASSVQW